MRRFLVPLLFVLGLAACGAEPVWAPDDEVARAHYSSGGTPTLTLFTVVNVNSGNGGHAALLVDAPSERVLFDPAGTFHHPRLPERNDVVYGMTDPAVDFFIDYHSRVDWRVVRQEIAVSPEVAEQALQLVEGYGAVPKAFCTNSVTTVLGQLPGFESINVTMFPVGAMDQFAELPGVITSEYHDDDPTNNGFILARGI